MEGFLLSSAFNLVPALVLYGIGKTSRRAPLTFIFALIGLVAYLLWAHGSVNLRASSTAAIALIFIPLYAVGAVVAAWLLGLVVHAAVNDERARGRVAGLAAVAALGFAVADGVYDSYSVAKRESRFPVVSINKMPLVKRQVFDCCEAGGVDAMFSGDVDAEPGADLLVLSALGAAVLNLDSYAVKSRAPYANEKCDHCVGMYRTLVADGKGSFFVASSDGLTDSRGRLLWANKAEGFSRVVPIDSAQNGLVFVAYSRYEEINLRNAAGEVLWHLKLPVEDVGLYVAADGQRLPFAITRDTGARQLRVYDFIGQPARTISLPGWAFNVQSIAWPAPGHLLVGQGSWIGILDSDGKEVLRHAIEDTSFDPYHGPDGVAANLCGGNDAFLAVMSHGSSGYARSALLVFDPRGRLVWQEEIKKARSILAARKTGGGREVILVGDSEGVVEYSLPDEPTLDPAGNSICSGR